MAKPAVWGPHLWSVLEVIGWKSSVSTNVSPIIHGDMQRELRWLLLHLETIIPCAECRAHIESYRKEHPLPSSAKEYSQWIWNLHDDVNIRLGKDPSPPWNPGIGSKTHVWTAWKNYRTSIKDSIVTGKHNGAFLIEFNRHLMLWESFTGL
jgi:hypothetical protein